MSSAILLSEEPAVETPAVEPVTAGELESLAVPADDDESFAGSSVEPQPVQ